ncbi:MAG: amidohydrolase family protein [Clostridia bacterium]|nr:amidohydrolase family protein [Clostridia bacterium]
MKTVVKNAKIVTATEVLEGYTCAFEDGVIDYIGKEIPLADEYIDAEGGYLVPGFIDLHCHGGNGLEFMDASEREIGEIAAFHMAHGTTTMLATTLAASDAETEGALAKIAAYKAACPGSSIEGVHLEGPWLSPLQCGAQNLAHMKKPDTGELESLKTRYPFILRAGAAPELEGGMAFGRRGKELGIVMSPAHTDADFGECEAALQNGYNLMTHLYSGMKGVTRKNAYRIGGAVEAGLYFDEYFVEIIADGKHLPKDLLRFIYKIKGADRIALITDAIRACGLPEGTKTVIGSRENGLPVIMEDGVAKLPTRDSFAGSASTFDHVFRTMADAIGRDMVALSKMASLTPARIMGWQDLGEIALGKRADLLILDNELKIKKVITNKENRL